MTATKLLNNIDSIIMAELFEALRWVGVAAGRSFLWGAILYVNRREIALALLKAADEVREFVMATNMFWMLD